MTNATITRSEIPVGSFVYTFPYRNEDLIRFVLYPNQGIVEINSNDFERYLNQFDENEVKSEKKLVLNLIEYKIRNEINKDIFMYQKPFFAFC